jgi:hypothetical protein
MQRTRWWNAAEFFVYGHVLPDAFSHIHSPIFKTTSSPSPFFRQKEHKPRLIASHRILRIPDERHQSVHAFKPCLFVKSFERRMKEHNIRIPSPLNILFSRPHQLQSIPLLSKGRIRKHPTQSIGDIHLTRMLKNVPNNLYSTNQNPLFLQQKRHRMQFRPARPISQSQIARKQFRPFDPHKRQDLAFEMLRHILACKEMLLDHGGKYIPVVLHPQEGPAISLPPLIFSNCQLSLDGLY